MLKSVAWLIQPSPSSILFALRLTAAITLAIYVSMWLELSRPYWAGLEAALMIQLLPGNTVARAAARVGGTLVAGVAALVILGLFRQIPELLIVALACWVSACAFGLQLCRNDLSHAFGVVGFISGVIVMFSVSPSSMSTPFTVAQTRVAECVVAAVAVAGVNVLLSIGMTARRYYSERLAVLRSVGAEMRAVIEAARARRAAGTSGSEDPHARLATLAQAVLALDQMRGYVRFEYPAFGPFDRLAQRMDRDLLALTSTLSSLHIYIARHGPGLDTRPLAVLDPAVARLESLDAGPEALQSAFDRAHDELTAMADADLESAAPRAMNDRIVLGRCLELADRMRSALARHAVLVAEAGRRASQSPPRSIGFSWPVNWVRVVRNSLASFTAILMAGSIWLHFHNQTATIIMVALGGAIATLFSAAPSPLTSAANFAIGAVIATAASFLINFFWIPMASGFLIYVILTAPVIFVAGLAMTRPDLALAARITLVVFELTLHTQNSLRINLPTFAQFALGIYGAVTVAMLAFALIVERDPKPQLRHQLRDIFKELARGLHGSRERFEWRIYDRLNQLALLDSRGRHPYLAQQVVLSAINLVLEARRLRVYIRRATLAPGVKSSARDLAGQIETALRRRRTLTGINSLQQQLSRLAKDLDAAFDAERSAAGRRLIARAGISAQLMSAALGDYEDASRTAAARAPALLNA